MRVIFKIVFDEFAITGGVRQLVTLNGQKVEKVEDLEQSELDELMRPLFSLIERMTLYHGKDRDAGQRARIFWGLTSDAMPHHRAPSECHRGGEGEQHSKKIALHSHKNSSQSDIKAPGWPKRATW